MAVPKNGFYTPNDADELRINFDGVEKLVVNATGIAFNGAEPAAQSASIADVTVTGTYATDDDAIQTAINSIIAALVAAGIVAAA